MYTIILSHVVHSLVLMEIKLGRDRKKPPAVIESTCYRSRSTNWNFLDFVSHKQLLDLGAPRLR